jgi:hypothetical protein
MNLKGQFEKDSLLKKHINLANAIVEFEEEIGYQFSDVSIKITATYQLGESYVVVGKINQFYFFGFNVGEEGARYKLFRSKLDFKFFFSDMKGLSETDKGFWRRAIQEIPDH